MGYGISAVHYSKSPRRIVEVECREIDREGGMSPSETYQTREMVLDNLNKGVEYITILPTLDPAKWEVGSNVHPVKGRSGSFYIRTDANDDEEDNLEKITELSFEGMQQQKEAAEASKILIRTIFGSFKL